MGKLPDLFPCRGEKVTRWNSAVPHEFVLRELKLATGNVIEEIMYLILFTRTATHCGTKELGFRP